MPVCAEIAGVAKQSGNTQIAAAAAARRRTTFISKLYQEAAAAQKGLSSTQRRIVGSSGCGIVLPNHVRLVHIEMALSRISNPLRIRVYGECGGFPSGSVPVTA